jgi:hypothetical protein
MGFEVPNPFKVNPSLDDELFAATWEIIEEEVMRLLEIGWAASLKGDATTAVKNYQAANIYFYFLYLAQAARAKLHMIGYLNEGCNAGTVDCAYGLTCIEDNLPCLSTFFDTDYKEAWDAILNLFGVDRDTDNCDDCCVGIGEMVIEDPNDCIAFIIGPCIEDEVEVTDPPTPVPPTGEFAPCEFVKIEFTEPAGDGVYDSCS